MKKYFLIALIPVVLFSCETKRPDVDNLEYSLTVNSIQNGAAVDVLDGETVVVSGTTDESGTVIFSELNEVKTLTVKVCKGTVNLVSSADPVAWTGCNETVFTPEDKQDMVLTIDFLSTFISKYDSGTSAEEWMEYLGLTTLTSPTLQTSLTDASKRYLWYQGIAKIAENVSKANSVTPETMYSTENLLNLLLADLADDNIINGSTEAKFGTLNVEALILKSVLADAIPQVSETFKTADLKTWTDKIRYSDAKFLGGSGEGVDSEKPVIEIETPENGSVIFGNVEIKATATDNVKVASLNCTLTGDGMPELEDTDEDDNKFTAVFDSTLIPDGSLKINCIASDGTSLSEKEISVTVSNSNQVTLSAFVTNPLTLWDSVTVYDSSDTKVLATSFEEEEPAVISLAPGTFRIVFKGGTYAPVFLNDETIEFDSFLETRVTVKAGEKTSTVATPLTTLREHLYRALIEKGDSKAETKSFDLISEHIDNDFPLYIEPVSKNQLTENSKYYIVLASLERLAVLIGERHDPPLEKGSVTIEQVLKALTDDLGAEDKAVLDGAGKINQFAVDSYLFRYWYAIAVKLFLESEENLTGLKFSDLQTVISNISMDESVLFPESEEAKKVTDKPPVISEKQFKRSFEAGFQDYSVSNIIYANDEVFSVKFKALPDESGDLVIDELELTGDIEVQSLSDINVEGIYTAELKFPVSDDGNKTILITAVDNAENVGNATLQAVKDTVKPVIETFELKQGEKVITGEYTTVPFTMNYIVEEENFRDAQLGVKKVTDMNPFSYTVFSTVKYGEKLIAKTDLSGDQEDGEYLFSVKFTDKAGNDEITEFQKVIDTVKPEIQSIVMTPQINGHGFINSRAITVEITATDNLEHTLNYWMRRNATGYNLNGNNPPSIFNLEEPADASLTYWFKVSDQAGNETPESEPFAFTIDTVDPVITISNKAALEAKPWRSDADELVLNYTIDELNRDFCELRINGAKADDILNYPTGNQSFKSHELLDPTIGPGAPNIVSIYCIDKAGNEKEESVNVYIDDAAPVTYVGTTAFTYDGSVVDPRTGTWLSVKPWLHASDNFGKKDNLTVRFYYTTEIRNSIGYLETRRYPASGFSTITVWQDTTPATGAHCTIADANCRVQIPHPSDTYLTANSFLNMQDKTSNFILFVEVEDLAGNKTQTTMDWVSDREPVVVEYGGFSYSDNQIWLAFRTERYVWDWRISANGVVSTPECWSNSYYIGGKNVWYYSCPFTANSGTTYNVTISTKDWYDNYTVSNCSAFNGGLMNFCFSGSVKADDPQLTVEKTDQTATTLKYNITSDSTITECKIYKEGSFFKNCAGTLGTGVKTETITTWDDANYTVTVKAINGSGVTAERSMNFYIDNTPTSFSLNIEGYQNYYDNTSPTLKPAAAIAGGVKKLTIYLRQRKVHATRKGSMTSCAANYCYETHAQKIYEAEPVCRFVMGTGTVCSMPVYTPPLSSFKSGYYTDVRYVIDSTITGESVEGVFDLAAVGKTIRIVKTADDKVKVLDRTINTTTREMAVQIVPSVISDLPLSASAGFAASVTGNKDVTSGDIYYRICGNDSSNMKTQYQFYPGGTKFRAKYSRKTYSGFIYTAYFKPNVDSYFFGKKDTVFKHSVSCGANSDCPVTAGNFFVSEKCSATPSGTCVANYPLHRSDSSLKYSLKRYDGEFISDIYDNCPSPENYLDYRTNLGSDYISCNYLSKCPFLRDFWYFRKDLKIKIVDDFGFSLTVTNFSADTYTDPVTCPQEKIITEQ